VCVDDEPTVLAAVTRDLRREFGENYRLVRASSGAEGLQLLGELRTRGDQVALIISDQRMPQMEGTEFLTRAREIFPEACRVLLTAYSDTAAAIAAINEAGLDYYLLKPWDPPEEGLYPVVRDLLGVWKGRGLLAATGVRIVGHRFSRETHELRDFIARNRVPGSWLDVESDPEAQELLAAAGLGEDCLPVVVLEDGNALQKPTITELAQRLNLATTPSSDHYDLVIVGGGPAGLAAAVYGASEGLRTIMVEAEAPGGQAGQSSRIENYLGFPTGLAGADLARRATTQARRLGAELLTVSKATKLHVEGAGRIVELSGGAQLSASSVIVSSGVSYRMMPAEGFDNFTGAGIYYGATLTEARSCLDQHVVVIGGANSAGQAAVHFSGYAGKVSMLVRGDSLTKSMSHYLIEQIDALDKIEVRCNTQAVAAHGENGHLEQLTIRNGDGQDRVEDVDACFVFIGALPRTDWLEGVVARDEKGFILAGQEVREHGWPLKRAPHLLETSVPGVFVAGDVRSRSIKRVASAVGEGSMAVSLIHQYLAEG
jgi:thioredoxin reductase (NADPH)